MKSPYEAQIEMWRERYESDPSVSHYKIADAIGCSQVVVSKFARLHGWKIRNGGTKRTKEQREAEARFAQLNEPVAAPSVWAWADMFPSCCVGVMA